LRLTLIIKNKLLDAQVALRDISWKRKEITIIVAYAPKTPQPVNVRQEVLPDQ
jgi:hypothetical protein